MGRSKAFSAVATYLIRVGYTPAARLLWALRKVNAYRTQTEAPWSPGDWENARQELAIFALYNHEEGPKGFGGLVIENEKAVSPSESETKSILESFKDTLESLAQRKPVKLGPFRIHQKFTWRADRYIAHEVADSPTWKDRTHYALGQLLRELGNRVAQCPTKLPHSRKRCLTLFLKAKRGKYCSRKCASREMTRKFRDK